jgi:hypothetical protein
MHQLASGPRTWIHQMGECESFYIRVCPDTPVPPTHHRDPAGRCQLVMAIILLRGIIPSIPLPASPALFLCSIL